MPDERLVLSAFMASLISEVGGYDAACAVLEARWGHAVSKGTLSKKKAGQLDWTVTDVIALQDAAGKHSVTRWMVAMDDAEDEGASCIYDAVAIASLESGESISSSMAAARDPSMRPKAIKETRDAIFAKQALLNALEAKA